MSFLLPKNELSPLAINDLSMSCMSAPERSSSHLRSVKYYLSHQFEVEDFSYFLAIDTGFPVIYSAYFYPHRNPNLQFRIEFYPKGDCEKSRGYLSAYLVYNSELKKEVFVQFKFSLLDNYGMKHNTLVTKNQISCGRGWGWTHFVARNYVQDPSNGLLIQDRLTIVCEVEVLSDQLINSNQKFFGSSLYTYQIESTKATLDSLDSLLKTGNLSDVTLVVSNSSAGSTSQEIHAHKLILASRSPVFKAMFIHDSKENRIEVHDVTIEVFEEFLHYIYTGSIDSLDLYPKELLEIANKYGVDSLKQMCSKLLASQLTSENVSDYLLFADRHSASELKRDCIEYINKHTNDVMLTDGWELASKTDPDFMVEMFHDLSIKSHPNIVNSLLPTDLLENLI